MSLPSTSHLDATTIMERDLFELVGMSQLSEIEKQRILDTLSQTAFTRALTIATQQLQPDQAAQIKLLPTEQLNEYFLQQGIRLPDLFELECVKVRIELVLAYSSAQDLTTTVSA